MIYESSLKHYGILGMKWGVRRYQNPNGTLTDAGKKHYGKMSGERIYKDLKKQVRQKRKEVSSMAQMFESLRPIGSNSKRVIDDHKKRLKEWESSKEYKEWNKKVKKLEKQAANDEIDDYDKYQKEWDKLMSERPKQNWNTQQFVIVYGKNGREYMNDYLNKGGKDLSLAYLKDLGYDNEVAKDFVDRMIRENRTLGTI